MTGDTLFTHLFQKDIPAPVGAYIRPVWLDRSLRNRVFCEDFFVLFWRTGLCYLGTIFSTYFLWINRLNNNKRVLSSAPKLSILLSYQLLKSLVPRSFEGSYTSTIHCLKDRPPILPGIESESSLFSTVFQND